MRTVRFFIFLIFNLLYRDGKNERIVTYAYSIAVLVIFEFLLVICGIDFLNQFVDINIFNVLESLLASEDGVVGTLLMLLFLFNYYIFIKKKHFDHYYNEFKDSKMNTKKNRKIGYICLIVYWPIMISLAAFF